MKCMWFDVMNPDGNSSQKMAVPLRNIDKFLTGPKDFTFVYMKHSQMLTVRGNIVPIVELYNSHQHSTTGVRNECI